MVHIIFDPSLINGGNNIEIQSGSGTSRHFEGFGPHHQRGYGAFFAGYPRQRGAGIGDLFRRFWRVLKPFAQTLTPVVKSAGRALGEEGLATTARVLSDVVQGANIKDSLTNQGREGAQNLLARAQKNLQNSTGKQSLQKGEGYKRKRKSNDGVILKSANHFVGRLVPAKKVVAATINKKRKRIDNLGIY
jgi:hypothetical protein